MKFNKTDIDILVEAVLGNINADIYKHSKNFLYHVTNIQNLSQIKSYGLLPQFGETVKQAYADYYKIDDREDSEDDQFQRQELSFDGILFFSEKPMLHYAHQGLGQYDLSINEVLLCVVKKNDTIYHKVSDYPKFTDYKGQQVDSVGYESVYNLPIMIETNDWFSFEEQTPVDLIYGERLQQFMQENFPEELKSIERMVAEELSKFKEGVADKYAEKEFNIIDPNTQMDLKATQALKPKSTMGEYIGDLLEDDYYDQYDNEPRPSKPKVLSRIFANPLTLDDFQNSVRAVSDINGNLFVAETAGRFFHDDVIAVVKKSKYTNDNPFIHWYRNYNTNLFVFSGSYINFYRMSNKELEIQAVAKLQEKNPQFAFKGE